MRNLFLALLLANLLFLGWQQWIAPPDVPAARLRSPGPESAIAALAPAPAAATGEGAAGGVPAAGRKPAAARTCMRVGPIADGQVADSLRAQLIARGLETGLASEEGQIWVGHWVQLESVASRAEADRTVARLAEGGLPDAYVLQTAPPFSISLGVFRDRERADKVAAAAAALGFRSQTSDRYRAGVQYWLSFAMTAGKTFSLEDLGRQSGQILRAEQISCPRESIGGAGAIN
jgi:cell division protein FtsN